jgi:hypothetical protein
MAMPVRLGELAAPGNGGNGTVQGVPLRTHTEGAG